MTGSFSYRLSQLNRTLQTQRQPGSAIKPVTYLTALQKGLQPNPTFSTRGLRQRFWWGEGVRKRVASKGRVGNSPVV